MKQKKIKILIPLVLFLVLVGFLNPVNADMGPKPSITIELKSMDTSNYIIDLLVYDKTGEKYLDNANYNGDGLTNDEIELLHNINYDGWISEGTRWGAYLLFADCDGNKEHKHCFSYFGTPDKYKVLIVNNDTGEIKISNEIIREDFTSFITLDYKTMTTIPKASTNIEKTIRNLIITIIVEVIIALIMKLKNNIKLIVIINIITNLILQVLLNIIPMGNYMIKFIIMEIVIIACEYLIYKNHIKEESNNKVLSYTLIANLITALLTFFIK